MWFTGNEEMMLKLYVLSCRALTHCNALQREQKRLFGREGRGGGSESLSSVGRGSAKTLSVCLREHCISKQNPPLWADHVLQSLSEVEIVCNSPLCVCVTLSVINLNVIYTYICNRGRWLTTGLTMKLECFTSISIAMTLLLLAFPFETHAPCSFAICCFKSFFTF